MIKKKKKKIGDEVKFSIITSHREVALTTLWVFKLIPFTAFMIENLGQVM